MMKPTDEQLNDWLWWKLNAPEGATHYREPGGMYYGGFYKKSPEGWFFFVDASWEHMGAPDKSDSNPLIPRPTKPAVPEWDGEGLFPLVHTDCEMADERGKFLKVRIVSWIDGYTIGWSGEREQVYFSKDPEDFRPLRTKEKREREELAAIIKAEGVTDEVDAFQVALAILAKYELKDRNND